MQSALLLELLAARQGGSTNPALQDMLARLRSGGDVAGGRSMQDMLAQLAQSNPKLSSLLQQMNTRSAPGVVVDAETNEVAGPSAREEFVEDANSAAIAMTEEIRGQAQAAMADLAIYAERTDRCAAALGACGLCWGEDTNCRACRGRGRPGFALPDEMLFEEMIVPAIRMLRAHRARPGAPRFTPQLQTTLAT
jgi:hypothetical protein